MEDEMGKVDSVEESGGHFFRRLFKLALFAAVIAIIARFVMSKKEEYSGLTVSEARAKFEEKLGPRLGEDTASDIADTVVEKLREKGILIDDPIFDAVDKVVDDFKSSADDLAGKVADTASDAADKIKGTAGDAADKIKDTAGDAADKVKGKAGDAADKLKDA
ncbi:MAG TPA: hypothetical protein VIW94_00875 [Acidimicrobiia bacterium]